MLSRAKSLYEKYPFRFDIGFFLAGFLFDVVTLSEIDDVLSIVQQVFYLCVLGLILYAQFLESFGKLQLGPRTQKFWAWHTPAFHFVLGSLLSQYSLFFLKSASFFSSAIFVVFLMGVMLFNELEVVKKSRVDMKVGLFVLCLFSFFSILVPVLLGFVGFWPFLLSLFLTAMVVGAFFCWMLRRLGEIKFFLSRLLAPAVAVLVVFLVSYVLGWIPPVPLSVQDMGIYHDLQKVGGVFRLSHENPWWRFWNTGDQNFLARPGDRIVFFTRVFSPGGFRDSLFVEWSRYDTKRGWLPSDRIPLQVGGGRKGGYRAYTSKQNYEPGEWRVKVETTNRIELGRLHFSIELSADTNPRSFQIREF